MSRLTLAASLSAIQVYQVFGQYPTTWNYNDHGKDWDFESCNDIDAYQSPQNIDSQQCSSWSSFSTVSFLMGWKSLENAAFGVSDYTYKIDATDGNMGVWQACEPDRSETQIEWTVEQVRFKYPSEHTMDGVSYDLEMQIILNDT